MSYQFPIERCLAICQKNSTSDSTNLLKRTLNSRKHHARFALIIVLMGFFTCTNSTIFSQDYQYQFQLQGVTDVGSAKLVTDVLRPVFNTEENPFAVFPSFIDAEDQFDFVAKQLVTKDELEAILASKGIVMIAFSSREFVQSETKKQ